MTERDLAVVVSGAADHTALERHFDVERIEIARDQQDRERLVNAAAFEASANWILLLEEDERIPSALADEIAKRAVDQPASWAYRIPIVPMIGDERLHLRSRKERLEIRLYHKRYSKLDSGVVRSRGTIMRLGVPIHHVLYETARHQMADYESRGVPHSLPRRIALFLLWSLQERALTSATTLGYLWRRAAWDLSNPASPGS